MDIYKKLLEACKDKELSVLELERQLGFSRGSLFKWNTSVPSAKRLKEVADKLEKPIEYFLE